MFDVQWGKIWNWTGKAKVSRLRIGSIQWSVQYCPDYSMLFGYNLWKLNSWYRRRAIIKHLMKISRSKTRKKLKERFLIGQNRTKRANFRGSPLFRATYNIKTGEKKVIQLILCQSDESIQVCYMENRLHWRSRSAWSRYYSCGAAPTLSSFH